MPVSLESFSACLRGVCRPRRSATIILGSIIWLAVAGGGDASFAQRWEQYPWFTVSGGYENDRILVEGPEFFAIPGGGFIDVSPGMLLSRMIGNRTRLNFDGQVTLERFGNEENRSLFGAALNGELRRKLRSSWRWRLTLGGNYFADSLQESINRYHVGAETGFGVLGRRGYLELLAGVQGRNYPNLISLDDSGIPGTYTELGASVGATGAVRPIGRLVLTGLVFGQTTDARDPVYDATSILAQAGVRVAVAGPVWLYVSAMAQQRKFSSREPGQDTDLYQQLGAGLEFPLGRNFDLYGRYAVARYTDTLDETDDIYRFSVGVTWWPGGRGSRALPDVNLIALDDVPSQEVIRAGEPHLFRLRAPEAVAVSLVAEFNGWDPGANPLRDAGNGWWEGRFSLPEGSYQYAFWVDGELLTPPDAEVTVDDGFGGRNGMLYVAPQGP
ncbi:MAG: glycogen-binding domain-containing protein [Candidatus Latescibacterota bacterium]|jgi:hypothetical protein